MSNDKRKSSPSPQTEDDWGIAEDESDRIKSFRPDPELARAVLKRYKEGRRQTKAGPRPAMAPKAQPEKRGWQLDRLRDVLRIVFPPDGRVPANFTHGAVQGLIAPEYEKENWKLPSIDSIARVRDRRKT
ncbi:MULTISPECIES: hypothetical protein [Bradyrhizobium]|jgi:hypothetical protein|uniref:Uncharacterized protein n=1 Tax=Bradyrhizobium japonicum TaxID=375 RepID=A0A1Y2J613_BRAJP|nr:MULTISPECIES: hypothetical protein [Bradyrhizobium]MDI3565920.1 hypothetical protein [Bradyrhizobium sp. Arg816]OSJ21237.1 hypothetical protein BSZ19_48280 [Bradyrhizobium japonicum]